MPYEERPVPEEVLYTDEESVDDILDEMVLSVFEDETILLDDKLEAEELRDEDLINTDNVILTADNSVVEKVKAPESHTPTPARDRIDLDTADAAAESVPIRDELDEFDELEFEELDAAEDFEPIEDELISEEIAFDKDLPRARESVHIKDELSGDYAESQPEGVTFKEEKIDLAEGEFEEKTYKIDESAIEGLKFEDRDNFSDEKELQNIDVTVLTDLEDEDSAIGDMSFDDEDFNIFAEESKSKSEVKDVMTDKRDGKQKTNLDALDIEPSDKHMENLTEFTEDNLEEIDILKIQDESSAAREEPADLTSDKFSEPDSPWDDLPVSTGDRKVFLIDDEPLIKPAVRRGIKTEEEQLSEIVSVIVDLVRGEAKQLDISTAEEETYLTIDAPVKFDDFHVETEEKISFIDDDIDFVDSVFLSDDESMGSGTAVSASEPEKKKVASAERQIDIDSEEMDLIEDSIFGREYTASDFDEDRDIVELEGAGDAAAGKNLRYILPRNDSLSDDERISIEEDIKTGSALILEEDVEEIKEKLDFKIKKKIEGSIQDITEKIRIIEDEGDLKESIRKMVLDNKDDLTRLIKYMDGLLGKLPDGEIKSFADSEYYDLYLKVLKEMNK